MTRRIDAVGIPATAQFPLVSRRLQLWIRSALSHDVESACMQVKQFSAMPWQKGCVAGKLPAPREWMDVVRLLEMACLFDPGNRLSREFWASVRWGRMGLTSSSNEFFCAGRRSEAWKRHIDRLFGFESVCPAAPFGLWDTNSVAAQERRLRFDICRSFQMAVQGV
jgi:hypothetical protein